MRLLDILRKPVDPFGTDVRMREERKLLARIRAARQRVQVLEAALASGEDVHAPLEDARAEIVDLTGRLPRGDAESFCLFCLVCLAMATLVLAGFPLIEPILRDFCGRLADEHSCSSTLVADRSASGWVWEAARFVSCSYSATALIGVCVLSTAWRIQRSLQMRFAGLFLWAASIMIGTAFVGLFGAFLFRGQVPLVWLPLP